MVVVWVFGGDSLQYSKVLMGYPQQFSLPLYLVQTGNEMKIIMSLQKLAHAINKEILQL